jgi:hypothetical protein
MKIHRIIASRPVDKTAALVTSSEPAGEGAATRIPPIDESPLPEVKQRVGRRVGNLLLLGSARRFVDGNAVVKPKNRRGGGTRGGAVYVVRCLVCGSHFARPWSKLKAEARKGQTSCRWCRRDGETPSGCSR